MALLWQTCKNGVDYQVRRAGNSLRLYTDGIFHSQWNPRSPLGGHLWDLLVLPALFHPKPHALGEVLMLGVGGGAAINGYRYFFSSSHVTGVDLDPIHLKIARRYFLKDASQVELLRGDAREFVVASEALGTGIERKKYDIIVDDVFGVGGGDDGKTDAVRPINVDASWLSALYARLEEQGLLIFNFEDAQQLRSSLSRKNLDLCGFKSVFSFSNSRYENAIAVCSKYDLKKEVFLANLDSVVYSNSNFDTRKLDYSMTKVI